MIRCDFNFSIRLHCSCIESLTYTLALYDLCEDTKVNDIDNCKVEGIKNDGRNKYT